MTKAYMRAHPKPTKYRDPNLLRMAKGRMPILKCPDENVHAGSESTVACHFNGVVFGKGVGSKAHDFLTVWGTSRANLWIDQGKDLSKEERRELFWMAYERQLVEWGKIMNNRYEPKRNQESAENAMDAWKGWVTLHQHMFDEGDWQLEWVRHADR